VKTFWLSFVNPRKPKGEQFLGVAIIEVEEAEARLARRLAARKYPQALAHAAWIMAASRKARRLGCNPGGEVSAIELPEDFPGSARVPRGQLLGRADLERLQLL
jgi:hypothetical protein